MSRITIERGRLVTYYQPYNLPGADIPVLWQVYDQHGAPMGARDNYRGPGELLGTRDGKRRELRVGADNATNFAWYTVDDNPTPESDEYDRGYRAGFVRKQALQAKHLADSVDYNDGLRDGFAAGKAARKAPKSNPRRNPPRPDAAAKAYRLAVLASRKAAERRGNLPAGSSRAAVTTANARWASAAEYRDRLGQELPAGVRAKVDAELSAIQNPRRARNPSPRTLAWSALPYVPGSGGATYEATRAGNVYAITSTPDGWLVTVNGKRIGFGGDSRTVRLIAEKHAGPAVIPFKRPNPRPPKLVPTSQEEAAQWAAEADDLDSAAERIEAHAAELDATQGKYTASPWHQQAFAKRELAGSLRAAALKYTKFHAPPEPKKRAATVKAECPPAPPCPRCGYPLADTRAPAAAPAPVARAAPPPPPEVWLASELKGTQSGLFSRKNPRTCRCRPAKRKRRNPVSRYEKVKALAERGSTEHERATAARILAGMTPPPAPPPAEKRYEWNASGVDREYAERQSRAAAESIAAKRAEQARQTAAARETLRSLQPGDKIEVIFEAKSYSSPPDKRTVTVTQVRVMPTGNYYAYTTSGRVMPGNVAGGAISDAYGELWFQTTMTAKTKQVISMRILARANPRRRGHR